MSRIVLDDGIITKKIGSGSFGDVYLAESYDDAEKHNKIACKIEERYDELGDKKASRLLLEYKNYKYLHKRNFGKGIPKILKYHQCKDYNIMYMQLLGPSLEDLFNNCSRKFSNNTTRCIAIQIIELLKKLHQNNFIHRDIKPNNFLVDAETQQYVNMVDLGLSKKYIHNKVHQENRKRKSLTGTARYASIYVHKGNNPSRRDDLISVGYMMIYFLKGKLPWQGLQKRKDLFSVDIICEKKINTSLDVLCQGVDKCFYTYLRYTCNLAYDETPDYSYMISLFRNKENYLEWIV